MTKRDKKQRRAKKRKEIHRHRKARRLSLPDLLRKEPLLHEALNYRHPLTSCLINKDWDQGRMANIFIFRQASTGLVLSCFHVDLAGIGLKDAWGNYGLTEADMEKIKSGAAEEGPPLTSCDLSLANTIVYGGIAWAEKWGFKLPRDYKIWLRLLEPVGQTEIDLGLFGKDGKPLLILDEDELDNFAGEYFYPKILKAQLEAEKDGIPGKTLSLMGDIKSALITFSRRPEFREELEAALKKQFGKPRRPASEDEWVTFQDWFILQYKLEGGETIAGRFVEYYDNLMSEDVRELILGWADVIEGLFEVKSGTTSSLCVKNLINEREYKVFPTASMVDFEIKSGDFLFARIVPAKAFHLFSGAVTIIEWDRSEGQRAKMYKSAMDLQMHHPSMAFKDHDEKLQKSLESARREYEDFVHYFGADEILGAGKDILHKYQGFFDYLIFEKKGPESGQSLALAFEKKTGKPYQSLTVKLPEPVLNSQDVGMLCDPVEGISFLIDYRHFIDVFKYPDRYLGKRETEEVVMGYLESDSISDIPFRRVAKRFPHNFSLVMAYYLDQEDFSSSQIDDLIMEYKPESFNKLPGIVTILDAEMARLARSAKEEPSSVVSRFKNFFKRKGNN
jgi:hypothetical protein